jgi:hypothetical protein
MTLTSVVHRENGLEAGTSAEGLTAAEADVEPRTGSRLVNPAVARRLD